MFRFLLATLIVVALHSATPAQPDPKKALVTKVYDLKSIIGERSKSSGVADADAVIRMIIEHIPVGELKPGTDGPQIVERDGGKLEVRVAAKAQGEIADLMEALTRLADVAVDVKADVIELDPAAFDKLLKALPKGKAGSPVLTAVQEFDDKLLAGGRKVQTSAARFTNGGEATLSARQSVLTFHQQVANAKPHGAPEFVKEGFKLVGVPVVSADRRSVRFKVTERSAAVTGVRKRDLGEIGGQKLVAETPELEDLGATGSATVADGGTLLFRLAYAPKDKVWVVVLRPAIHIQAEEDARKPGK